MEKIKDVLVKVFEKLEAGQANDPLKIAWHKVVDQRTQQHAQPLNIKRKTLLVVVDSSAWLYDLNLRKKLLLANLKAEGLDLEKIKFWVGKID